MSHGRVLSMGAIFFFFQAEDGIRYLVRSRGLGDVYKRQTEDSGRPIRGRPAHQTREGLGMGAVAMLPDARVPVSYTHLTLPTSDLV